MENVNGSQPKRTLFIVLTALLLAAFAYQLVIHAPEQTPAAAPDSSLHWRARLR